MCPPDAMRFHAQKSDQSDLATSGLRCFIHLLRIRKVDRPDFLNGTFMFYWTRKRGKCDTTDSYDFGASIADTWGRGALSASVLYLPSYFVNIDLSRCIRATAKR